MTNEQEQIVKDALIAAQEGLENSIECLEAQAWERHRNYAEVRLEKVKQAISLLDL